MVVVILIIDVIVRKVLVENFVPIVRVTTTVIIMATVSQGFVNAIGVLRVNFVSDKLRKKFK